jgi:hypothetical protein
LYEFLISSLHSTCSVYFMHCNLVIPIICGKIKTFLELRHKSVVKMLCTWLNLVILKVLPACIHTHALKVLVLLEEPLKVLYWYCCELVVAFCWFSSTNAKLKPLSLILSLGNRYKLHDLENMVVEGWLEFSYSPKTAAECRKCDKVHYQSPGSNCYSIFLPSVDKQHSSNAADLQYKNLHSPCILQGSLLMHHTKDVKIN